MLQGTTNGTFWSQLKLIGAKCSPSAKRVMAAWRILVGVWIPKRWELSLAALSQYTSPNTPPENPWVDRPKTPAQNSETSNCELSPSAASSSKPITLINGKPTNEPVARAKSKRRPPSRRIVRHVLRARIEAAKALSSLFDHLERTPQPTDIKASVHLAQIYGYLTEGVKSEVTGELEYEGRRNVHEMIGFLTRKGGKIPTLKQTGIEGEWAAMTSEADGDGNTTVDDS